MKRISLTDRNLERNQTQRRAAIPLPVIKQLKCYCHKLKQDPTAEESESTASTAFIGWALFWSLVAPPEQAGVKVNLSSNAHQVLSQNVFRYLYSRSSTHQRNSKLAMLFDMKCFFFNPTKWGAVNFFHFAHAKSCHLVVSSLMAVQSAAQPNTRGV